MSGAAAVSQSPWCSRCSFRAFPAPKLLAKSGRFGRCGRGVERRISEMLAQLGAERSDVVGVFAEVERRERMRNAGHFLRRQVVLATSSRPQKCRVQRDLGPLVLGEKAMSVAYLVPLVAGAEALRLRRACAVRREPRCRSDQRVRGPLSEPMLCRERGAEANGAV